MKNIHSLMLIAAAAFAAACSSTPENTASETTETAQESTVTFSPEQLENAALTFVTPQVMPMNKHVEMNGVVDVPPQNLVSVSFPLGGFLKSTDLLPGMKISKGQEIAIIEDQALVQLQQDYLIAKSNAEKARKDFERQKTLNATKSNSDKVFEEAVNAYNTAQIMQQALHEKLALIGIDGDKLTPTTISKSVVLRSPINGYVSNVNVNIGKYVSPTDVLFELVNPSDLHLALTVFEKDIDALAIGQRVHAHLANNPNKIYNAEIILISKKLDANRSTIVHCHFEDNTHDLLPGMFLNAMVEVANDSSLAVPKEAVVRTADGEFVFIQKTANEFELTPVTTGGEHNGFIEIKNASNELKTSKVVDKNAYTVLMKMMNTAEEE